MDRIPTKVSYIFQLCLLALCISPTFLLEVFPNIGSAFRGYDLVKGDPTASGPDRGYRGVIFDEAHERSDSVNFDNTNVRITDQCNKEFKFSAISNGEEYLESVFQKKGSGTGIKIGSDVDIGTSFGGSAGADLSTGSLAIPIPIPGLPFPLPIPGISLPKLDNKIGLDAGVKVNQKIPPLFQASSSNSDTMSKIISSLETDLFSLTKLTAKCYLYSVEIQTVQHPNLKKEFIRSVKYLESCMKKNAKTENMASCAKVFFENYGTHYINVARFGSKMTFTKMFNIEKTKGMSVKDKKICSTKQLQASLFGLVGGDKDENECNGGKKSNGNSNSNQVAEERLTTIGSRPKESLSDWAEQVRRPEIIEKQITPLSNLFTDWFMDIDDLKDVDYKKIKPWLEDQILSYCAIFRKEGRCSHVVRRPVCTPTKCKQNICGYWTGPIDTDFLPQGKGVLVSTNSTNKTGRRRFSFDHGCVLRAEGSWEEWKPWSTCSQSCGGGIRKREANCVGGETNVKNWCEKANDDKEVEYKTTVLHGIEETTRVQSEQCNTESCAEVCDTPMCTPKCTSVKENYVKRSRIDLICPGNMKVRIVSAKYGNDWFGECFASSALPKVKEQCGDKNKCSVKVSNDVFGDPCPLLKKHLKICSYCSAAPVLG